MRNLKQLCAFVLLVSVFGCARFGEQPDAAFVRFRDALDLKDLGLVSVEVNSGSLEYLKSLEPWVYAGNKQTLGGLKSFDRYMILRIRMLREDWSEQAWAVAKQGGDVLEEGVIHPLWLPLLSVDFVGDSVERVDFVDGIAGGHLYASGRQLKTRLRFVEEGQWKVDLISYFSDRFQEELMPFKGEAYRNLDLVEELFDENYGDSFSDAIYDPRLD